MALFAGVGRSLGQTAAVAGRDAAELALTELREKTDQPASLAIVFASVKYDQQEIVDAVRQATDGIPLVGCSTSGEITQTGPSNEAVVVMLLSSPETCFALGKSQAPVAAGDTDAGRTFAESIQNSDCFAGKPDSLASAIMLSDALSGNGAEIVRGALSVFGENFLLLGGAAGDDQRYEKVYQYVGDEVVESSVTGFGMDETITVGVGVRHGWETVGLPMRVTRSSGATIHELDGRPAIEVYKQYFGEEQTAKLLQEGTVFTRAQVLAYPFGLTTPDGEEVLIRSAYSLEDSGSITCAAEIPQGSEVHMMIGSKEKAIAAAADAAEKALEGLEGREAKAVIIFNCVARQNLLGEDVGEELQAIRKVLGHEVPIAGFYTYSEQAPVYGKTRNIKQCETSFHNQTVVICALG